MNYNIIVTVQKIIELVRHLSDSERAEVFDELRYAICLRCGGDTSIDGKCNCTRKDKREEKDNA